MFYRSIVAFDHAKQVVKIISLVFDDNAKGPGLIGAMVDAENRNNKIRRRLEEGQMPLSRHSSTSESSAVESNYQRSDFQQAVTAAKELIYSGECYQVVLSQRFTRATRASDVSVYRALRSMNPSPYMFLLRFSDKSVIGASPEMLVRCEGNRLEYRPIAGTRPRGKTASDDAALAEEMRSDSKEVAEHLMLVDLGRNDLGRVAEFGTVRVEELMNVEKYSHV